MTLFQNFCRARRGGPVLAPRAPNSQFPRCFQLVAKIPNSQLMVILVVVVVFEYRSRPVQVLAKRAQHVLLHLVHALVNHARHTSHSRMRTQKGRRQVKRTCTMTVAKATRLSWGRPSQKATVWSAWASSFTRLWGPTAARANCAPAIPPQPARDSRCHFRRPRRAHACWTVAAGSRAAPPPP